MSGATTLVIVGNLVDRPELRVTESGTSLARFSVAATERTYDKAKNEWRDGEPLFMTCTAWRELAEHAAESLTKGARVIVTGRLRTSRWETPTGEKRSMVQLDVDEIGPSLRFATARVNKLARSGPGQMPADDPFATARPTTTVPANGGGSYDDEPPF